MNEEKKNNKLKKQTIFIIISVVILIYLFYMIYNLAIKPTETFIVENGKISLEEPVQGYIIRDEEVLKGENYKNGLVQIKAEGEKNVRGDYEFEVNAELQKTLNNLFGKYVI